MNIEDNFRTYAKVCLLAGRLFNRDDEAIDWLTTPQQFLFGKTVYESCMIGQGESIVEFLQSKLG